MKPIRSLDGPPQGLVDYRKKARSAEIWQEFRDFRGGEAYLELIDALTEVQHGLCGYCEIDLRKDDRQVEHVIPRSDPLQGLDLALDISNLIACCNGGTMRYRFGPIGLDDHERYASPIRRNMSCGQAKGGRTDGMFIDPRTLPTTLLVIEVRFDGRIDANENACVLSQISIDRVRQTINILGLNVPRLRRARENRWRAFNENWHEHFSNGEVMEAAARTELLPAENGLLPKFFTTARSFFSKWGEAVLDRPPRRWI